MKNYKVILLFTFCLLLLLFSYTRYMNTPENIVFDNNEINCQTTISPVSEIQNQNSYGLRIDSPEIQMHGGVIGVNNVVMNGENIDTRGSTITQTGDNNNIMNQNINKNYSISTNCGPIILSANNKKNPFEFLYILGAIFGILGDIFSISEGIKNWKSKRKKKMV